MIRIVRISGGKAAGYGLGLTVWLLPLVICNRMMWDFYYPKELFFQASLSVVLIIQLFRKETTIHLNWLDAIVITGLLLPGLFSSIFLHSPSANLRLPFYTVLFYLLIKSLSFESQKKFFHYFLNIAVGLFSVAGLIAFYGILQYCGLDFLHPHGMVTFGPKVVGTLGNANIMGGYLALIFPLGIVVSKMSKEIKWKILTCIGLVIIICALILTESRGAWLALSVSLIAINYRFIKTAWQKIFKNRIVSLIVVVCLIVIGSSLFYWLINLNQDSAVGRLFVWRIAWNMCTSHPIFGIGFQRYPVEYLNYQADFFDNPCNASFFNHAANMKQADNEYLQILAENGIIGMIFIFLFIVILYRYWLSLQKNKDAHSDEFILFKAIGISLAVIFLHSIVDNPLRGLTVQTIFIFLVGMISLRSKIFRSIAQKSISIRNTILLRIIAIIFLVYTIFNVIIKSNAYIDWREGQGLFKAGFSDKGIDKYRQAQRRLPDNGELLFHLGSAYAYTNQPEKALPLLQKSKLTFNDKNIYINEGLSYYRLRDFKNAEKSLLIALRMYPELLLPRLWLAEVYIETERKEEAIRRLNEIEQIQPKTDTPESLIIKADARRLLQNINSE